MTDLVVEALKRWNLGDAEYTFVAGRDTWHFLGGQLEHAIVGQLHDGGIRTVALLTGTQQLHGLQPRIFPMPDIYLDRFFLVVILFLVFLLVLFSFRRRAEEQPFTVL